LDGYLDAPTGAVSESITGFSLARGVLGCGSLSLDFVRPDEKMMPANSASEVKTLLVEETAVQGNGEGPGLELGALAARPLLLVLHVREIIEQESLHVSVWGSCDGKDWTQKPLFLFPQIFYAGATPAALDLAQRTDIKFLQARWQVNRWGRGYPRPHFLMSVEIQELNAGAEPSK
jgi:hypothetical protein